MVMYGALVRRWDWNAVNSTQYMRKCQVDKVLDLATDGPKLMEYTLGHLKVGVSWYRLLVAACSRHYEA